MMKMTLNEITVLTAQTQFHDMLRELAEGKREDESIDTQIQALNEVNVQAKLWHTYQLVAVLYDTYGDDIGAVEIHTDYDRKTKSLALSWSVGNCPIEIKEIGMFMTQALSRRTLEVDEQRMITCLTQELHNMINYTLVPYMEVIEAQCQRVQSSFEARINAQNLAPEINAWAKAQVLARRAGLDQMQAVVATPKF